MFVANRVRKIAKIANEVKIDRKYCPSEDNIADPRSRGANLDKMEKGKVQIGCWKKVNGRINRNLNVLQKTLKKRNH